jgi:hypothetical protein
MTFKNVRAIVYTIAGLGIPAGIALAAQDKYALQVPNGLAFSEFKEYKDWQVVATRTERCLVRFSVPYESGGERLHLHGGGPSRAQPPAGTTLPDVFWRKGKSHTRIGVVYEPSTNRTEEL